MEKTQQTYGLPKMVVGRFMERKPYCGVYGRNHHTTECLPMKSQRQHPHMAYWCSYHKRWGNHSTKNCYNCENQARQQAMRNIVKGLIEGDKARLVLDRQPPLPKAAFVRIINQNKEEFNMERAIVQVMPNADNQMSLPSEEVFDPWGERALIVSFQDG